MTQKRRDDEERAARLGLLVPARTGGHADVSQPAWMPKPSPGGKEAVGLVSRAKWFCPECTEANRLRRARALPPLSHCNHRVKADDPDQHPDRSAIVMTARVLVDASLSWAGSGHAPTIEVELSDGSSAMRLAFGWAGLSTQEAQAWELYCAGFSYPTIGRFMDRSDTDGTEEPLASSTVKEYISRGRAKLKKLAAIH